MKYILFPLALMASQATAQESCMPREVAVTSLGENYGESRRVVAMTAEGLFVEMFASDAGVWTLLGTRPDGISCIFAYGENFEVVRDPLPIPGQDG
jgi:hypothetical protein